MDLTAEGMAEGMLAMAASLDSFEANVIRKYSEMRFSGASVAQNISSIYMDLLRS
ncbi:hypothetical protein D3C76_1878750 [compost metagenome]